MPCLAQSDTDSMHFTGSSKWLRLQGEQIGRNKTQGGRSLAARLWAVNLIPLAMFAPKRGESQELGLG